MNSISISERYGVYLLVLFAVALLIYILISLVQSFSLEQADRKIRENRSEGLANNVYYFVSRTTLQQIQLSTGILLAGALVLALRPPVRSPGLLRFRARLVLCLRIRNRWRLRPAGSRPRSNPWIKISFYSFVRPAFLGE